METIFKYIVYQTVNTVNNKIYIGIHKTATLDFDGYIGNNVYVNKPSTYAHPKTLFQRAVKKYGVANFKRTVLKVFDTLQDALDLERFLVDEQFIKRPDTYNMILGGKLEKPTNTKSVYLYDKYGQFYKEFSSQEEAGVFIYGKKSCGGNISRAIKTGAFCGEYQVSNTKVDFMKDYITYKDTSWYKQVNKFKNYSGPEKAFGNPKLIAQYDLQGNLIQTFKSIGEAKRAGFTNVQGVLEGTRNSCKGFTFKYYED